MSSAAESLLFPRDDNPTPLATIIPRDYQIEAHDNAFELWDGGEVGVLNRLFTGGGKTILAALQIRTWLARGDNYRAMVISYENQLVWQFAEEIKETLGIVPGIEQAGESVHHERVPKIIVASRQTLAPKTPADEKQIQTLADYGITEVGALTKEGAKSLIRGLAKGIDPRQGIEWLQEFNARPEVYGKVYSRVHKFDPIRFNWLIVPDEAHRHAYMLHQVKYWVDWFERNPNSRRSGLTATPKRSDNVSIGDKMFPGIAIDYPLTRAVSEGYAVPYVQRYVSVEGIDFSQLKRVAGDFDDADLERVLGEEAQIAKLVEPLLDMVGNRPTLIYSPGVQMSKDVDAYINARCETKCPSCNKVRWYGTTLIGDGAVCPCGQQINESDVTNRDQSRQLDGSIPPNERREIFRAHQEGKFQFLSVCALCREGYNDPNISCVAVFRPVTKKAASLAEQMKGRGCRPLRGLIHGLNSKEERLTAIATSHKPNTLIVDLVGISSLADCASTIQIYADGLPDEIVERAEELLAQDGIDGDVDVAETIERAKHEIAEERERIKREREEAQARAKAEYERRAAAEARAKYTTHEVGVGHEAIKGGASEKQINYIGFLGMRVESVMLNTRQAGRIIDMLQNGIPPEQVAYENGLSGEQWSYKNPSPAQQRVLTRSGVRDVRTPYEASILIDAIKNPQSFVVSKLAAIKEAGDEKKLDRVGRDLKVASAKLPPHEIEALRTVWKRRREELRHGGEDF